MRHYYKGITLTDVQARPIMMTGVPPVCNSCHEMASTSQDAIMHTPPCAAVAQAIAKANAAVVGIHNGTFCDPSVDSDEVDFEAALKEHRMDADSVGEIRTLLENAKGDLEKSEAKLRACFTQARMRASGKVVGSDEPGATERIAALELENTKLREQLASIRSGIPNDMHDGGRIAPHPAPRCIQCGAERTLAGVLNHNSRCQASRSAYRWPE